MCKRRKSKCLPGPPGKVCTSCAKAGYLCSLASLSQLPSVPPARPLKRVTSGSRAASPSSSKRARSSALADSPPPPAVPVSASPVAAPPPLVALTSSGSPVPFGVPLLPQLFAALPPSGQYGFTGSPLPTYFAWRAEYASSAYEFCAARDGVAAARASLELAEARLRNARHRFDSAVGGFNPYYLRMFPSAGALRFTPASVAEYANPLPVGDVDPPVAELQVEGPSVRPSARARGKRRAVVQGETEDSIEDPDSPSESQGSGESSAMDEE